LPKDIEGGRMLRPITVVIKYTEEPDGEVLEEREPGFLIDDLHAIFVETEYYRVVLMRVEPTDDPDVYLDVYGYCTLGVLDDSTDPGSVISALTNKLNNMTAYDFLTKVVIHVKEEIGFGEWIIPGLITV
jgi:hypothetical protein